ncbi:MAG: hypothetical protein KF760_01475 [Candidatus Eremiobacteraeota bacterium]|nr:hypothetical protein [Candidatus Eremiobacteraeota bacterium]MCW5871812.1 hypothetical protein [Candidatus Eremiobacteraeota bacterium]
MIFLLIILIAWLLCFGVSKIFAMWSPGRARRAYRIARVLAGLFLALAGGGFMAMVTDHSLDGGAGMAAGITGGFFLLCFFGALLNVGVCWRGARREAQAVLAEERAMGFSRMDS